MQELRTSPMHRIHQLEPPDFSHGDESYLTEWKRWSREQRTPYRHHSRNDVTQIFLDALPEGFFISRARRPDLSSGIPSKALPPRALLQALRSKSPRTVPIAGLGRDSVLPVALSYIGSALERSRRILDLPPNFDGEGSPAYSPETWKRAARFLVDGAIWSWEQLGEQVPCPLIGPGPNGSFDLDWNKGSRTLLLNFPADPAAPPTFYGDNGKGGFPIDGELDLLRDNFWLFAWLVGK